MPSGSEERGPALDHSVARLRRPRRGGTKTDSRGATAVTATWGGFIYHIVAIFNGFTG